MKEKDRSVLVHLYEAYGPSLYGMAYQMVRHEKTAEKVLQDTFHTLWQEAATYDPQKTTLFTWMMMIARKQAQRHSALTGQLPSDYPVDGQVHASPSVTDISPEAITRLLNQLSSEEQEIVRLAILAGHTDTEVARQLGISVDTVRRRLRVAFVALRKILPSP